MEEKKIHKINIYLLYAVIFAILSISIFSSFIINGKSFIWNTDGYKQHYIFFEKFYNTFKNLDFSSFSWGSALGLDNIGQYSYYILGDPFNFIGLLFPSNCLQFAYEFLIILRIFCVGLSFIAYCNYNKKSKFATIVGVLMYTFCEFILFAAVRHPFFTNAAILLPLMLISIDKILSKDNYKLFIIITAITAISNYYFLYMITILTFIYAVTKYFSEFKDLGAKEFFRKFLKTGASYIIGILISSIIMLPSIYAFINSARTNTSFTYYSLSYYVRLILMNNNMYWSKIYVCSIIITILPIALLSFKKNKQNRTILINLIIQFIILLIPLLGSIMNGFSFQSNRWSFGFAFFMSYLVTCNLRSNLKYTKKELLLSLIFLLIYAFIAIISISHFGYWAIISIIFAYLILAIFKISSSNVLTNLQSHELKKHICQVLIILVISLNIILFAYYLYVKQDYISEFISSDELDTKYSSLYNTTNNFDEAINYIKSIDSSIYRIGTNYYGANNLSLKYDYNGLNTFLSIGNKYVDELSKDLLILNRSKTNPLHELDSRTQITTLLGCKYYIVSNEDANYVPYGYTLIKKFGDSTNDARVYKNENSLSIGVFYNNYILEQDYESLSPLDKEQTLLNSAVISDENSRKVNQTLSINSDTLNISENKEIDFSVVDKNNNSFKIQFNEADNCELYLYIENLDCATSKEYSVIVTYNGIKKQQTVKNKITSAYYEYTPNILINLGYSSKHSGTINVNFSQNCNYSFDDIKLIAVPMDYYENKIYEFKQTEFVVQDYDNNSLTGKINNSEDGIVQFSVSYSDGWVAYVDGVKTDIINVNTGFIGIPLTARKSYYLFRIFYSLPKTSE